MRVFAIFGDIEFIDGDAYVRNTQSCAFMPEDEIVDFAEMNDWDYLMPHYFNGRITFMQYHKESAE